VNVYWKFKCKNLCSINGTSILQTR
jgi:hypothetical protein